MISQMFFPRGWEKRPRHDVSKGPDKWDFINAFADGDSGKRKKVFFRLKKGGTVERITIEGLNREGSSGHEFIFIGVQDAKPQGNMVFGYYNTKNTKGWIGCVADINID